MKHKVIGIEISEDAGIRRVKFILKREDGFTHEFSENTDDKIDSKKTIDKIAKKLGKGKDKVKVPGHIKWYLDKEKP